MAQLGAPTKELTLRTAIENRFASLEEEIAVCEELMYKVEQAVGFAGHEAPEISSGSRVGTERTTMTIAYIPDMLTGPTNRVARLKTRLATLVEALG